MAVRFYEVLTRDRIPSKLTFNQRNWLKFQSIRGFLVTSIQRDEEKRTYENTQTAHVTGEPDSLEEPTNCCMSGCANCVWIKYAEQLIKQVDNGDDMAKKVIFEKVQDPNMRAFLEMELRTMAK